MKTEAAEAALAAVPVCGATCRNPKEEEEEEKKNGVWIHAEKEESSESSSIGAAGESSGDDDEAESKPGKNSLGSLSSLDSLEDSLPIKRGLSNFFGGKSKSFASLTEMANTNIRDLEKPENPLNKRRRILMASKNSGRRASYGSLHASLPPLLTPDQAVDEGEEGDDDEEKGDGDVVSSPLAPLSSTQDDDQHDGKKIKNAPRSLSLSDLQHA